MDFGEPVFDNVKFEKMKAMARFNRFRKIAKLLQFLEVLVALMLVSWSSTYLPRAAKVSGKFLFELGGYLLKPHVVFVIGNAIIVVLFVLCRDNVEAGSQNSGSGDIYDDYVRHSEVQRRGSVVASVSDADPKSSPQFSTELKPEEEEEKQIVCVHSEEIKERPEEEAEHCHDVTTAIESAAKQIQKFQRTQSEKLKSEIAVRGELRRSETERRREETTTTSFDSVDSLSNEEFNLTVDAFIKRHQAFLKEQKIAENEGLKRSGHGY